MKPNYAEKVEIDKIIKIIKRKLMKQNNILKKKKIEPQKTENHKKHVKLGKEFRSLKLYSRRKD